MAVALKGYMRWCDLALKGYVRQCDVALKGYMRQCEARQSLVGSSSCVEALLNLPMLLPMNIQCVIMVEDVKGLFHEFKGDE